MGFSTDAIHGGQSPDSTTGAVITPIYQTSTFVLEELGKNKGYTYGRTNNFTRAAMEKNIAILENGKFGISFSSGIAAVQALISLLKAGDNIIVSENVYGGTYRLFEIVMKNFGLDFTWVDTSDTRNIESSIKENTKLVFVETPTNPLLSLTNLAETAEICKRHKLISVVDNTFMSPFFQRPLEFGIDISLHSTTKYINGHSDVIGGILLTSNSEINDKLKYYQNAAGAVPSPFDCWLVLRSTKTLSVRMERHNSNAMVFAKFLEDSDIAQKVYYPGLENHPQHQLAKKQMSGFGGMVSADFGTYSKALKILNNVKIFSLAESLGGVESLINYPAQMTHSSVPKEKRDALGITDSLIRFSVGLEDIEDLINDVKNASKL